MDPRTRTILASTTIAFAATCSGVSRAEGAANLLKAGDFEGVEGRSFWHSNGGAVVNAPRPGGGGRSVFRVTTAKPGWRMGRQKVTVPEGAKSMRLSGWARTEDVKPPPDVEWRRAQMQIGYHDAGGQLVGQWNDIDLPLGRSPWTFYKSDFPVPAGARTVIVFLGNNNVSGTSVFDDVRVEPLDRDGKVLGVGVGAAKLAGVETVVKEPAPEEPKADAETVAKADAEPDKTEAEADDAPEADESGDDDSDDAVGISAFMQAMIGGGAVLAMMVVFALVARGRSEQPSGE
jgi:hypothetical protein